MLQLMEAQRVGHDLATEQQRFKQKAFFFFLIPGYKHKIFSLFLILYLKLGENFDPNCFVPAAAAAAKSLQLCLTLCDPIDGSPPDSPIPGILQARTLEWVAISFSNA